jgi:hypothetical protein
MLKYHTAILASGVTSITNKETMGLYDYLFKRGEQFYATGHDIHVLVNPKNEKEHHIFSRQPRYDICLLSRDGFVGQNVKRELESKSELAGIRGFKGFDVYQMWARILHFKGSTIEYREIRAVNPNTMGWNGKGEVYLKIVGNKNLEEIVDEFKSKFPILKQTEPTTDILKIAAENGMIM